MHRAPGLYYYPHDYEMNDYLLPPTSILKGTKFCLIFNVLLYNSIQCIVELLFTNALTNGIKMKAVVFCNKISGCLLETMKALKGIL